MSPVRTHKTTHNRDLDRVPHILTDIILAIYQHARLETYATVLVLLTGSGYIQSVRMRANDQRSTTEHAQQVLAEHANCPQADYSLSDTW